MAIRKNLVSRYTQLDKARRRVLVEAAWTLTAAQAAVRLLPFRWIAAHLGRTMGDPEPKPLTDQQLVIARQIAWAIQTLVRYLPQDVKCLGQAIAGKWMLQRRGLPSTLYLGVDRGGENWLEAHAWLRCGPEILTGEPEHSRFKVIATFTEEGS